MIYREHKMLLRICKPQISKVSSFLKSSFRWNLQEIKYYSTCPGDQVKSVRAVVNPHISKIRNIGIMAHIDAGKTTTTERILYYSGYIRAFGDVDDGDTVTDFMVQERERGITIQSAAVTFDWNNHRINLIDTPGHVDFTVEVERALRVLDGAVTVFDSSAGVEAQTMTVWRQADKHHVPRICFLNKMDKIGSSFTYSVESIKKKLHTKPLVLQVPIGTGKNFKGVVDLITNEKVTWESNSNEDDGRVFERKPLTSKDNPALLKEAKDARNNLIEQVADLDDEFAEVILGDLCENIDAVPSLQLQAAIRRVTLAHKAVPVLCGSALKNKGIQPLLDAITLYLPAPNERNQELLKHYGDELCALAFKVLHDKQRGPLVFVRIYSGTMKPQSSIYNINKNITERMSRLLLPFADQHVEISSLTSGNIALTVGLKQTATGDTVVSAKSSVAAAARRAEKDQGKNQDRERLMLAGVEVPQPVFFCTIEPPSMAKQAELDHALNCLQREDPSLIVKIDPDSGQTVLCGMGELHIEIIHDRIKREFGIEADLGPLQVAYRETIMNAATASDTLDRMIGGKRHLVNVQLTVSPWQQEASVSTPVISYAESVQEAALAQDMKNAVENGMHSSCLQGPLLGFPVQGVQVTVLSVAAEPGTSLAMISACSSRCTHKALKQAGCQILEPLMSLAITVDEDYLGLVLGDLSQRRGNIQEVQSYQDNKVVSASVPLANMMGYSTVLRTLTSGTATFTLELSSYEVMTSQDQSALLNRVRH
ncbi:ribosome-releasing factor 2, mitochondrial [Polypterus senegalus]|nr:ribosome-releasing factor 2, mitochondrial [Polypterus senegalus]XP_039614369.1 ribosome-releasing factor 2, mitochondrial [Polypterus senegalus]XP_039614370.1 ribosome-releasing factor 2, mitochondrial [Polypterus senegalus]XP_039614371.1 ribosome-releasing factor 2, mitochondrial [Polypterus senegalus]